MGNEIFVRNVEELCRIKGKKPTVAMKEAGLGHGYLSNLKARGNDPKDEPVRILAQYFGVTPAQLRGEVYFKHTTGQVLLEGGGSAASDATPGEDGLSIDELRLVRQYRAADEATRQAIRLFLRLD